MKEGIGKISCFLEQEDILAQVAEECCELAQAVSKRIRILKRKNLTPISLEDNYESVQEEIADVFLSIDVLIRKLEIPLSEVETIRANKLSRWLSRLRL